MFKGLLGVQGSGVKGTLGFRDFGSGVDAQLSSSILRQLQDNPWDYIELTIPQKGYRLPTLLLRVS